MPEEAPARIISELTSRGYNADREAVTLLAGVEDTAGAIERTVDAAPETALKLTAEHVRTALSGNDTGHPIVSTGTDTVTDNGRRPDGERSAPIETEVSTVSDRAKTGTTATTVADTPDRSNGTTGGTTPDRPPVDDRIAVSKDVTGRSTGTGTYDDFVTVFRDRYERLVEKLRGRVNHRPAEIIEEMPGGSEVATIGMVDDVRSTASGHRLVELEDPTGTVPCLVMKDREFASAVEELLFDEVIAIEGTLSDDAGVVFVDAVYFPDIPRSFRPSTADRQVRAALVSDIHVGSQEFHAEAWEAFADWLHTGEADDVEYLLVAGDMVEGVGVYPDQDEELDVVDIYAQYERFAEHLKSVPGDTEIVLIPGNHDAVRLAEPQPGFDDDLRAIMSAHDARIHSNPAVVDIEGVSVLMYHGTSLDEVIAELPEKKASYDRPQDAMAALLKKRHLAPRYGGKMRLAPEDRDYLVVDDPPDVFHTGHVHKLGYGTYHNVLTLNSGCWQRQTDFQRKVDIDPDVGYAPILDLSTHELEIRHFG